MGRQRLVAENGWVGRGDRGTCLYIQPAGTYRYSLPSPPSNQHGAQPSRLSAALADRATGSVRAEASEVHVRAKRMTETMGRAREWTEPLRPGRNSLGPVPLCQTGEVLALRFHRDRSCGRQLEVEVEEQGSGVVNREGSINQVVTCNHHVQPGGCWIHHYYMYLIVVRGVVVCSLSPVSQCTRYIVLLPSAYEPDTHIRPRVPFTPSSQKGVISRPLSELLWGTARLRRLL